MRLEGRNGETQYDSKMPVLAVLDDPSVRSSLVTDTLTGAEDTLLNELFFGGNKHSYSLLHVPISNFAY